MDVKAESERRGFILFHVTLGTVVFIESAITIRHGLMGHQLGGHALHAILLGSFEAIGAELFLIPRTVRVGGMIMILSCLIAILIHGLLPELRLFVYAAGTAFVMVRGVAYGGRSAFSLRD
jgi:hypothetical protein